MPHFDEWLGYFKNEVKEGVCMLALDSHLD